MEFTHSKGSIRRFIRATLEFLKTRPLIERRKVMKIVEANKLNDDKSATFVLAFHPIKSFKRMLSGWKMDGVSLDDLKMHVNSTGGPNIIFSVSS